MYISFRLIQYLLVNYSSYRYAYIVFCLEKIKEQMIGSNMSHVKVLYDVACQLQRHLKV